MAMAAAFNQTHDSRSSWPSGGGRDSGRREGETCRLTNGDDSAHRIRADYGRIV